MTNEELLQPRFKLIADYPGNSRSIGSVSTENAIAPYFRKFPANFLELKWWEERDVKDLPLYVKTIPGYTFKIRSYDLNNDSIYIEVHKIIYKRPLTEYFSKMIPATESEHIARLNNQI